MPNQRCAPPRTPFVGSGRTPEGGFLAVHKRDFNSHVSGVAFRHCADHINMNPPLNTIPGDNVQEVLENIELLIGGGDATRLFVSVGIDGGTEGDYNVGGSGTPTFESALAAAFADSQVNSGGVVVILAGDYTMTSTVTIPSGIMLWGENGGVIINGVMADEPMFLIAEADPAKKFMIGYDNVSQIDAQISVQSTKLFGMTLVDNRFRAGSDVPSMVTVPMVRCRRGCNVLFDQVTFLGAINSDNNTTTRRAIGFETNTNSDGSSLSVHNCVIDGVSSGIEFRGSTGSNDFLEVDSCRIRYFGSVVFAGARDAIFTSVCNAQIQDNTIIGFYEPSVFLPQSAINIAGDAVTSSDVRFNVLNNSGSSNNPNVINMTDITGALSVTNQFKSLLAHGNNWGNDHGSSSLDIYISATSGNGTVADVNGTGSLQLILDRVSFVNRETTTVYMFPGTYNVTESYSNKIVSLIGLPTTQQVIVRLNNSITTTDPLGRITFYLGHTIKNIQFSTVVTGSFPSVTCSVGIRHPNIDNCNFLNCGLLFETLGPDSATTRRTLNISKTTFSQSGTYANNLSLWIQNSFFNFINIEHCAFNGSGYQIFAGRDFRDFTSIENAKLCIADCNFTFSGNPLSTGLPAPWDPTHHKYIFINNPSIDFTMERCVLTHSIANYVLLDQTALDGNLFGSYERLNNTGTLRYSFIRIIARNININNVTAKGLYQRRSNFATSYIHILPIHRLSITNTSIESGYPIRIFSNGEGNFPEERGTLETTPVYVIENCSLFQPDIDPGFDSLNMLHMLLRPANKLYEHNVSTDINFTLPSVTVQNCSIQQTKKPNGANLGALAYDLSGTEGLTNSDTFLLSALGWHISVKNNTILSKHPAYSFSYGAMSIAASSSTNAPGPNYIIGAKATISENKVTCYSQTSVTDGSNRSTAIVLAWNQCVFVNNIIQYITDTAATGDRRGFMTLRKRWVPTPKTGQEGSLLISNNAFILTNTMDVPGFWVNDISSAALPNNALATANADALFSNNVISTDSPNQLVNKHWFNIVPHYMTVRLDQTQNISQEPGVSTPNGRPYESSEITYYLWNSSPYNIT